jgi:hypothetical protein
MMPSALETTPMTDLRIRAIACVLGLTAWAWTAFGAEYFVGAQGRDEADGRSRETAFRTVQKGVDALQPGDTLTIGPGEYFERVSRADLGAADRDTVIRSEVPGMAVLRGDAPAPEFRKAEGFRFVHSARFEGTPLAVMDHHSRRLLFPAANAAELEFSPGGFHYDAKARTLYLSNPDLAPAEQRRYTVAVTGKSGLELTNPRRVTLDGLSATGFYPGWGLLLTSPVSCVVRNCVSFMNVGGITLQPPDGVGGKAGGSDNVVENCVCFGNSFGGIVRYTANNDVIRNCRTFGNVREGQEHFGVMHYSAMNGPLLIANNLSWGQNFDYSVKPGNQQERIENCVALGYVRIGRISHNVIGGGNEYDRGSAAPADNILFRREQKLDVDFEFADPLNLDFRLQPESRFRGSAPDKSDRGAYAYAPNVFYLSATGDDQADGLSMRKPWRTLDRALKALRSGDTLYLAEGEYAGAAWSKAGDGKAAIRVCGRGRGTVVIRGKMTVVGATGLALERLAFADGLGLSDCRDVAVNNCTFFGTEAMSAEKVAELKVTHSLFAGAPLVLKKTEGALLRGNLYANAGTPALRLDATDAVRFSDYNGYQDPARCREVGGVSQALRELQPRQDAHSVALTPELAVEKGAPRPVNAELLKGLGPHSATLGPHYDYQVTAAALGLVGPFLHSTSDTTADIEWWATHPASYTLSWGETPEMKNVVEGCKGEERFNTFSLTGLKPGQSYHFAIRAAKAAAGEGVPALPVLTPKDARLAFTTAAVPAVPKTYYVAPEGDDNHNGLSREQAFRTVNRAADRAGPGDTVLIAGGGYAETVRVRAAGTKERPVSFRAIPGEKPVFKGENVSLVFQIVSKPDVRLDGLYFDAGFWDKVVVARRSPRLQVTRCFNAMIAADECPETLVRNCIVRGGWSGLGLSRSPGACVEHNVFVMTILRHISCDSPAIVRNNIFCECVRNKGHQTLVELGQGVKESDNCFYMRWPEDDKLAINWRPLTEYRLRTGSNAVAANPMISGVPGWKQGWQQSGGKDFNAFFTGNPRLVLRGVGLRPEAFEGFSFAGTPWAFNRAWAEAVTAAMDSAAARVKAGNDAEALAAYVRLIAAQPMPDRVKAEALAEASRCAQRLKDYDQAIKLAKGMPVRPLSVHRQMEVMLEQKDYAGLLKSFTSGPMGGESFHLSWTYPELEDVLGDLFYYRSIAYRETGNLAAAEADLKVMNEKKTQCMWRGGEAVQDLAWLRLGDFYRDSLKDDDRALAAYNNVLDRTTWDSWGRPRKPAALGAGETLIAATKAVSEILKKQGKAAEIPKLQFNLLLAQAEAAAGVLNEADMLARFKEMLALPDRTTPEVNVTAARIDPLAGDARVQAVKALAAGVSGLTDDTRDLLVKSASSSKTEDRKVAVRALAMFMTENKAR